MEEFTLNLFIANEWFWRMDYCKEKGLTPTQSLPWNESKVEYLKLLNKMREEYSERNNDSR